MHNIRLLWLTYATTAMLLALMKKTRTPAIIIWMILAKIWGHVRAIVCLKKIQYKYIYICINEVSTSSRFFKYFTCTLVVFTYLHFPAWNIWAIGVFATGCNINYCVRSFIQYNT